MRDIAVIIGFATILWALSVYASGLAAQSKGYGMGFGIRAGLLGGVIGWLVVAMLPYIPLAQREQAGLFKDARFCPACRKLQKTFEGYCAVCGQQIDIKKKL